jgi:PKD repeat protein
MIKKYALFLLLTITYSCYQETLVVIEGDFTTSFVGADESIPAIVKVNNKITGADTYKWEFEGATPAVSTQANPGEITYDKAGTYTIKLIAQNQDGEQKEFTKTIEIKDAININFTAQIIQSNNPPVEVQLTNNTLGIGLTYNWEFENGNPKSFTGKTPPKVIFSSPGNHNIKLTVSNGFESQSKTQTITVAPYLVADFTWTPNFEDQDYQSPVKINLMNQSVSATSYSWTFQGGNPATSIEQEPKQVVFTTGTFQITLTASNDKTSKSITKTITVLPDTNLTVLEDVKFGINVAHNANTVGAFYAIKNKNSYTGNQVNNMVSSQIDIAFQGLNANFTFNKFISPDQVSNFGFQALTGAQKTIFINSQDLCNCGLNFTVSNFDAMINDAPLQSLNILNSTAGAQEFGKNYPRIVLFKTQDGRKGVIKVKDMIQNGSSSYLLCDIKVQKQ